MEYLDIILTGLAIATPFAGGAAAIALKKLIFFVRAASQAVEVFEELEAHNKDIFDAIHSDPKKKELARVVSGAVKRIEGLTGV